MTEYKSNSDRSKTEKTQQEKKIEKVVTGSTKTRKKSELSKFKDVFISDDVSNVKSYILMDVLVPAVKKALYDIVTGGIDRVLYGGSGRSSSGDRSGSKVSYISYDKKFKDRRDDPRDYQSARARTGIDYDDIVFDSRGDAERVLAAMDDAIDRYEIISINDMYDMADISSDNYTLSKYGWTNIRNAEVVRIHEGYVIKMPKPQPLDR